MVESVQAVLASAVPDRSVAAVAALDESANPGNRTVRVRFSDGAAAFLKLAVDGDRTRLARATAVLRYVAEQSAVRVPTIRAADPQADPPYLLTAPLSGTAMDREWQSAATDERAALLRAVGRTLAAVHEVRFEQAGRIVGGDGTDLQVYQDAWPALLAAEIAGDDDSDGGDDAPEGPDGAAPGEGRFEGFERRAREAVLDHREALTLASPTDDQSGLGPRPALLHGDPRPANWLRGVDRVGIVDWEQAIVGDPVLDCCRAEGYYLGDPTLPDRDRLRSALYAGYRERAGDLPVGFDDRRCVYRVVTFLPVASRFDRWASDVPEPTEELAEWVRTEFDRRLEQL